MKHDIKELLTPILIAISMLLSVPFISISQNKVLKLNLDRRVDKIPTLRGTEGKLVSKIECYIGDYLEEVMEFSYDSDGRVTSLSDPQNGYTIYYNKEGDKLSVSIIPPKGINSHADCNLNEFGYIVDGYSNFIYDSNGQTIIMDQGSRYETRLTWENGNLIKAEGGQDQAYTYTSIPNKANLNFCGLLWQAYDVDTYQLGLCGYIGNKCANLMATLESDRGRINEFKYDYDEDGYVTAIYSNNSKYFIYYDGSTPTPTPDPEPDPTPGEEEDDSPHKLVKEIRSVEEDGDYSVMQFFYDKQNRVTKITEVGRSEEEIDNWLYEYTYSGNTLEIVRTLTGSSYQKDGLHCMLNTDGYIIKAVDWDEEYGEGGVYTYDYDTEGHVSAYYYDGKLERSYQWINGNVKEGGDSSTEVYTYSNETCKSNLYIPHLFMQLYSEDWMYTALTNRQGKNPKNLISSYHRYGEDRAIDYEFDSEGYVTKITEDHYGTVHYISYEHNSTPTPDPGEDNDLEGLIEQAAPGTSSNPTDVFVPSEGVTLGKTINLSGKHIRLTGGSIKRSSSNPNAMFRIDTNASLTLEDVTIDGGGTALKDGSLVVYGKLRLGEGVTIKNCNRTEANSPSGVICVAQNGYIRMDKGTKISGNTGVYGSAIYCEGEFEMYDGEISGNQSQIGAVTINAGGTFIMHGGKISGNEVTEGCGGVFIGENCTFRMDNGEISGNDDCDVYSWVDIYAGGSANVKGTVLLTEGNKLQVTDQLRNQWNISFIDDPLPGTVLAAGSSYQLKESDLQHISYINNAYQLKHQGNTIVIAAATTGTEDIIKNQARLTITDQSVRMENFPVHTTFKVYQISGKLSLSEQTDSNGQASFSLPEGIYILKCQEQTYKFKMKH